MWIWNENILYTSWTTKEIVAIEIRSLNGCRFSSLNIALRHRPISDGCLTSWRACSIIYSGFCFDFLNQLQSLLNKIIWYSYFKTPYIKYVLLHDEVNKIERDSFQISPAHILFKSTTCIAAWWVYAPPTYSTKDFTISTFYNRLASSFSVSFPVLKLFE